MRKNYRPLIICAFLLTALLTGVLTAHSSDYELLNSLGIRFGLATPTPTPQPKTSKPKRSSAATRPTSSEKSEGLFDAARDLLQQPLAATDFNLIGLVGTAAPATQTVPKNIPTAVLTGIQIPEGGDAAAIIAGLNPNYRIRGDLSGPSLTAPRTIEARIGQSLPIPPLPNVGDHVLQNLRIVDVSDPSRLTIAPVMPDSVGITVIDNILVSQVQVTEMTYEQIIQSGINLNNGNYNFYNFVIGLGTGSTAVSIQIPVALPTTAGQVPVIGNATGGVSVDGVSVPLPDVVPVMLEGVDENGNHSAIELPGGGTMQIPGVVVFPGRIGLLHQFFEAIVIVANGAPNGTPLVITNLRANANLPDSGTPNDPADDPLRIAETQQGGVQSQLEIHGLGADGRYGTPDDTTSFNPGQSGQATFLLEGLKEGLHTVNFNLEGTLQGLPTGNVTIRGSVPGAVLVRDAEFGVTFTHPSVVRAGQEYDLGLTVYNSGTRNLNGIALNLRGDSVSGATLIDSEQKMLTRTIEPGSSGTVKWRLRSNITGQVTASYIKVGDGISAGLNLVTGVGDRNIPLSPDSLILPDAVNSLPPEVVEAARQMLGQAWSISTAPPGLLPASVLPVSKQTVIGKAVELGWAGLRVKFHEARDTSLRTLLRDWIGENQANSSSGFADAIRNTPAGYYFFDVVGTKFFETVGAESPSDFHKKLVAAESSRSSFVSAYVSQNSGQQILGAKIISPTNQSVGFGAGASERFGDLRTGASLNLLQNDPHDLTNNSKGNLLIVSKPTTTGNWSLELNGWSDGNTDVSLLIPTTGKNYRQLIFGNVGMSAGKRYRISFRATGTNAPIIEEFFNGAFRPTNLPFTSVDVNDPNPEITGVVQVTEDVIEGGDKFGRLVGVLFSKPMTKTSVETLNRYQIGGGTLVSDPNQTVGKLIKPTGAYQNFGERFSILALDSPVGPYIKRTLTASNIIDKSGKTISGSAKEVEARVSPQGLPPGGYMTGRVMQADGTPVPNAGIYYRRMKANPLNPSAPCGLLSNWETVSYQKADANGEFAIDYVREGDCHPVTVLFQNPATNSEKSIISNIAYDGQHLIFNAVFLARGNVQGTVRSGGVPLANANVSILSELDPLNNKLVRTNAQGFYSATGVPVGGVVVKAVGTGAYSLSSGIAAGNIGEPGGTATIDVATQNVSGIVKGKVLDGGNGQAPVPNSLVVAKAYIPGFPSSDGGPIPVGYAFTGQDGSFTIDKLPIGNVFIVATDRERGVSTSATAQLTPQNTQIEGIILLVSNGFGRVLGRVLNEVGQPLPNVIVQDGTSSVRADSSGKYILPRTREGNATISAFDPVTRQTGSTTVSIRRNEDTTGADIVIRRPANLNGQVFITQNGITAPLAQASVSADGLKIVRTDSQGRYVLNGVESGKDLTLRFVHPQGKFFVNTGVYLNPGENLTRNATFRPGRIHGKITQPDGVTPVVTGINFTTSRPHLAPDVFFGLPELANLSYQTTTDGLYAFESLNPVDYRVAASNVFFPIPVSRSGILPPNADLEINLSLVDSLTGKIHGHIYQPDGTTPVGAGVKVSLGGGSLSDVTVRTDTTGYYEFAEVFSEGGYILKAVDPLTNRTNQTGISVGRNQDIAVDLRLLGRGTLKVKVVDGGGNPLQNGSLRVEGSGYPSDQRYIELTPVNNGRFEFADLTEGSYAVSALYQSLGGRVSGTVTIGGITEVTIQVQSVGSVTGRVYMPNGTSAVGLADVALSQNGRIIGLITTQDSEEERGKFSFDYVPTGDFTIDVFDNRTGRSGRSAGTVTQQGQIAVVNVNLLALGAIVGQVTSNGVPAEHALVNLSADGSGISGVSRVATTDADGRYRFPGIPVGRAYLSVTNGPGGLTGQSQGIVSGTNEPLPDTVINVRLTPTATVTGTIYKAGGSAIYSGAIVKVSSNNYFANTVTDVNGRYRLNFVPLGSINVSVESPSGYDRGRSATVLSNQPGATVTADVTMAGVGSINGTATGSGGSPLTFGKVTFTNTVWNENISVIAPVQPDGTYSLNGLPAGEFNLKLTVPEITGVGTATDSLTNNQTLTKNLQLEPAGKVFGSVKAIDGTSPAVGADVRLSLTKQGGGFYTFITHTDSGGNWQIDNLPLGTISVRIDDPNSGGIAVISALTLNTNGQQIDAGSVTLDNSPIAVESITPSNNAVGVPRNSAVRIIFTEPVDTGTVNSNTIQLRYGNSAVGSNLSVSADGRTVTLVPNPILADQAAYTTVVSTSVKDRNGLALLQEYRADFTTADETAPSVAQISPTSGSLQVAINSRIIITVSEPVASGLNLSQVVQIAAGQTLIGGAASLDSTERIITFVPTANLSESTIYTVTVNGLRDQAGNVQTQAFTSNFATVDLTPPVIDPLPIDGTTVRTFRPTITATYHDAASGISSASVLLKVDGNNVGANATITGSNLSYVPNVNLTRGVHNVSVRVSDNVGNVSPIRSATFTIDDAGPIISGFTIGGTPIINGAQVTSSLLPRFEINYTDDTGINTSATALYLGVEGTTPLRVQGIATNTKLTYQPTAPLAEGSYVVRAVITNNLGTATDTGILTFTLDVDAPNIQTVAPTTGNQHGGTRVLLAGVRLLNTNGSTPSVTVGNNPANIVSASAGTGGSPDQVMIVTPPGVPGSSLIKVTTDRGSGSAAYNYEADPKSPFTTEADTLLMWHLDETADGGVQARDAGSLGLHGGQPSNTIAAPGRFASGRSATGDSYLYSNYTPLLNFGANSFTGEFWFKSTQSAGNRRLLRMYNNGYGEVLWFDMNETGAVAATVVGQSGAYWTATMPGTTYDVDDNQWHHLAMVVDRTQERLVLYVDGQERAAAAKPAAFDQLRGAGYVNQLYLNLFNAATVDELRLSSSAHSAQMINQDFIGESAMRITSYSNPEIYRNNNSSPNEITVDGYNLENITAQVLKNGQPIYVAVNVVEASYRRARLKFMTETNTPLGFAQVVITKSNEPNQTFGIRISELNELVANNETVLLWHLNNVVNNQQSALDSGALGLHGYVSGGEPQPGRFAGGAGGAGGGQGSIQTNGTMYEALNFGTGSFTGEQWFKATPYGATRNLMYLHNNWRGYAMYINMEASGTLVANVLSTTGVNWSVVMPGINYDVDNNEWHHVALVVDRTENKLKLYLDGVEKASAVKPANFDVLSGSEAAGYDNRFYSLLAPQVTVDEVRISSKALSSEEISQSVFGYDSLRLYRTYPGYIQKGVGSVPVIITGYGLNDVSISTNNPNVSAVINSSTISQLELGVTAGELSELGNVILTLTNPAGQTVTTNVTVVDQRAFADGESGTVLLWHLNNVVNNQQSALDSGALGLHGYVSGGEPQPGRFAGGAGGAGGGQGSIQTNGTMYEALNFGTGSFTGEQWFKATPYGATRNLMYLHNNWRGYAMYINMEASGTLVANVLSTTGVNWGVAFTRTYDPQNGYWTNRYDDGYWHHVALVVDRTENKLKLYLDGVEKASAVKPANFDVLSGSEAAGYDNRFYSLLAPQVTVDEVKLSNFARSITQIRNNWFGTDSNLGLLLPKSITPSITAAKNTDEKSKEKQVPPESDRPRFRPGLIGGKSRNATSHFSRNAELDTLER